MIRITAKKPGIRRCGVFHTPGVTEYPGDAFTAEQLQILQAEPRLTVDVGENAPPNYARMTVAELRALLVDRGIDVDPKAAKAVLIEDLTALDQGKE